MMKELTYAIIGCGSFGRQHIRVLKTLDNSKIIALCDKHLEKIQEAQALFGLAGVPVYEDFNKMLEEITPDVVVVATADHAHALATVAALQKGFHVMCEKPMALIKKDCQDMIRAQEETGKILFVGQICRFTPGFVKAKKIVDSGIIGDLYYVESEYAHDYTNVAGVDEWRKHPDREPIIGGACHAIDLLRWIAGDPTEVFAYSTHKNLLDWPVNDTTISVMKFPDDVIGKVFCSIGCKREYTMRTCLYGTKGTIVVNNTDPKLMLYLEKPEDGEGFCGGMFGEEINIAHAIKVPLEGHNVKAEHEQMRASVLEGKEVPTPGIEGAKTVAVCSAVVASAKSGMPVQVDYTF